MMKAIFATRVIAMKHSWAALLLMVLCSFAVAEPLHRTVELSDGSDMDLRIFPAEGNVLMIGFPCDLGSGIAEQQGAEMMAARGIEVWMADLLGAHFLPIAPSSMRELEGSGVRDLIALAHRETNKQIVLSSSGYGAMPTLRGAKLWHDKPQGVDRFKGTLLFFPMLAEAAPEPGKMVEYHPIVHQTATPLYIFQPEQSPQRFWLKRLTAALQAGGATVYSEILPGVRANFYQRPEPSEAELDTTRRLPELMLKGIAQLTQAKEP